MRALRGALSRAARRRPSAAAADAGTTLVEVIVAMGIFSVVIALFMVALTSMTTSTSRVQNTGDAGDSLRRAFLVMDRQVRYADSINWPGRGLAQGDWYVEFRTPGKVVAGATAPVSQCTQWRYDTSGGQLLMRTWPDGSTPPTTWTYLATVVKNPTTQPFTVLPPVDPQLRERLSIDLNAGSGFGANAGRAEISSTFTARNSSSASPSLADSNSDGVSDTPVCAAGVRS